MMTDMFQGAEAYLEMWERAVGVRSGGCLPAGQVVGAGRVRLGSDFRTLLLSAGQPQVRRGRAYRYCVAGGRHLIAVLDARGRVSTVLSDAAGFYPVGAPSLVHRGRRWSGVTLVRGAALRADERAAFA
jgi:hypothetical protein